MHLLRPRPHLWHLPPRLLPAARRHNTSAFYHQVPFALPTPCRYLAHKRSSSTEKLHRSGNEVLLNLRSDGSRKWKSCTFPGGVEDVCRPDPLATRWTGTDGGSTRSSDDETRRLHFLHQPYPK